MVTKWLLHLAVLVCYSETVVSISRQEGILQDISIRSTSGNPRCYIRIEMNPKEVESAVQQLSHHQKSPADFIHFPPDEKVTINKPATIILLYGDVAVLDMESQKNVLWYCRDATQYLVIDEGSKDERFIGWLIAGLVVGCILYCPAQPPPDRTIPVIECPRDMHLYAPALETECTVSWTEPVAYDARDPDVSTRRDPEWLKPGETLKASEWPYSVRYSATDASGNFNSCSFLITVSVIRCPHPTQQQHIGRLVEQGIMLVRFYPDTNDYNVLLGTTFVATCAYGYSLSDGSAQNMRTCTASGAWDGADVTCIKVQCEPLRPPFRGRVYCTDEYKFLSECTYNCDEGFDIPSGMNRVRVCTAAAEWTGNQPQCKDIMRPKIIDCPGPLIIEYLGKNEQEVSVVWDGPTVVDNADFSITAKLSMGQPPGSSFTVGSHTVLYTAIDTAGNEANPCEFTVSVRAITCPVIHKKPYQLVSCPGGNSYGSRCEFSCEDGAQLIGTNFSYCGKEGDPPVGYWDWEQLEGSQPKCEGHPCRPLRVPQNGALACDKWLYGKFCTMLCNDQYDIPPNLDDLVKDSLWVCGSSGNWNHPEHPDPPHCSEYKRPNSIILPSELQYFTGDCGNADTQDQIRENFVQIFIESGFGSICANLNCAVDNVNVICGEATGRKSADTAANSSEPFVLTIKFDFALPISGDISVYEGEQVLYSLAEETVRLASSGNWTLKNLTRSDDFLNMKSFKPGLSEIQCPVGMEPRYNTLSCVGCSVGTFYNSKANLCQTCPIGSYQDESSQHSCKRCPYGQSTVSEGASNSTDCKHECKPGTFSSNGVQPCTPCNNGEYQPTRGQLSCISCQPATTTLFEGAVNASACENFDFQFPSQNQNHSSYVRYGDMEFKNSSGITVSFWLWFDKNCDRNASIFYYHCVDTASDGVGNESALYPCLYMKSPHSLLFGLRRDNDTVEIQTGTTLRHETWHHVGVVYKTTNNTYTITVDGSVVTEGSFTQRQQHLQETINQRGSLWLGYHIADGEQDGMEPFAGFISNVNIWSHAKNESDLLDMAKTCVNKDAGDVLSWSQLSRAEQRKVSLQIPSLCDDTDECASAPCGDNQCVDQLRDYSCICKAGFTGRNCEINIDDCEDNVCQNNATCLDGVGNYTCLCPEGFVGDFCGVESVDGNWTPWSQWSSCSVSCGGGNHSRTRECINPRPMHGGSNCTGPPFEIGACNTEKCPVCKNLTDPVNGFATCNSTDDEIHCTISCKPGFEFYDQPVLHYYCGQSTSYLWNHESPRNPLGRYPPCSEATQPKALDMKHVMTYSNLSCNTKEMARLAKAEVNKTIHINVEEIECIKHKSCYVRSTTVENCLGMIGESHAVTVILELSSISVADMGANNTGESHSSEKGLTNSIMNMESAAKQLKNMTLNDAFTVFIDNEPFPVDNNATKTSGAPDCAIGEVAVMFYCVPCPVGTSFNNRKCVKCDIGTYQNETGQVNCMTCPTGLTTEGFGAFDKEDCRVTETTAVTTDQPITNAYAHAPDSKWISVGFGTAAALIFACLVAVCWLILKRRSVTKAQVQPSETATHPSKKYIFGVDLDEDQGRHPTANQMKLRGDVFAWNGDYKCESKV